MAKQKLTDAQVLAVRAAIHHGDRGRDIAAKFGVSEATISQIKHGTIRKNVKAPEQACVCAIEMATFRESGSICPHCGFKVLKGGRL